MHTYTDDSRCREVRSTRPPTPPPPPPRRLRRRKDSHGNVLPRPNPNPTLRNHTTRDKHTSCHGPGPIRSVFKSRRHRYSKDYVCSSSETSDTSRSSRKVHPPYSDYSSSDEELSCPLEDDEEEAEVARILQNGPPSPCSSHFDPLAALVPASLGNLLVYSMLDKISLLPTSQIVQQTHRPSHMPRVRPTMQFNRHGNPLYPSSHRPYIFEEDDAEYRIAACDGRPEASIPLSRNHFDHCLARHTSSMLRVYRVPSERSYKYESMCAKYGLISHQISKPGEGRGGAGISLWMQGYQLSLEQLESKAEQEDCWMLVAGKHRRREFDDILARKMTKNRSCTSKVIDATTNAASRLYSSFLMH